MTGALRLFLFLAFVFQLLSYSGGNAFSTTRTRTTNMSSSSSNKRRKVDAQQQQKDQDSPVSLSASSSEDDQDSLVAEAGRLEELKQREAELSRLLADVRREKLSAIRSRPLTIGVIGFGRFGQFIARTFTKYGNVVVTSRSDYTEIAQGMGVKYVPLSDPEQFLNEGLDVIVVAVSILSFESTIRDLAGPLRKYLDRDGTKAPLIIDVLSVKEHPRQVLLDLLPKECDVMCTHPMFGPDSGKDGWTGLNFVYEKTRIDSVVLNPKRQPSQSNETFVDETGKTHSLHEDSEAHVEGMDRMERFLSIWEEEGCRMVQMSCREHDAYAANSQFITHLMGRILGEQGLSPTPIDTRGFENVLNLVDTTTADSFDLFYGLYKYNQNAMDTITNLQAAMEDVVKNLRRMEKKDDDL